MRRKERAEQKILRRTTPEPLLIPPDLNAPGVQVEKGPENGPVPDVT